MCCPDIGGDAWGSARGGCARVHVSRGCGSGAPPFKGKRELKRQRSSLGAVPTPSAGQKGARTAHTCSSREPRLGDGAFQSKVLRRAAAAGRSAHVRAAARRAARAAERGRQRRALRGIGAWAPAVGGTKEGETPLAEQSGGAQSAEAAGPQRASEGAASRARGRETGAPLGAPAPSATAREAACGSSGNGSSLLSSIGSRRGLGPPPGRC